MRISVETSRNLHGHLIEGAITHPQSAICESDLVRFSVSEGYVTNRVLEREARSLAVCMPYRKIPTAVSKCPRISHYSTF